MEGHALNHYSIKLDKALIMYVWFICRVKEIFLLLDIQNEFCCFFLMLLLLSGFTHVSRQII